LSEIQMALPRSAVELRAWVRAEVEHLDPAWRVIAEGILGLEDQIDLIAIDGRGRVVVTLLGLAGEDDRTLLTRLIAQRSWVAARLGDWAQLAPELELDPNAPVRGVLIAPDFSAQTRTCLKELGPLSLELIRYSALRFRERPQLILDPLESTSFRVFSQEARDPTQTEPKPPASVFRSGLSEEDLGLNSPDVRQLDDGASFSPEE